MVTATERIANDVDELEELVTSLRIGQAEQVGATRSLTEAIAKHEALDTERHGHVMARLDTVAAALSSRADDLAAEKARRADLLREAAQVRAHRARLAKLGAGILTAALPILAAAYGIAQTPAVAAVVQQAAAVLDSEAVDTDASTNGEQ